MKSIISLTLLCLTMSLAGQEYPFNQRDWEVNANGSVIENFEGKRSLYLFQGTARLKDQEFFTGVLEYDIYVTERRGFPGIHFRMQDRGNYEEFYIRPHQSGNPDANQYTPVFNGNAAWQLYFGERFSTAYAYKMNSWNHIKLVVTETELEVYINDMDKPMLTVDELKHVHKPGGLELSAGGPSGFRMANFKITRTDNVQIKGKAKDIEEVPEGLIKQWSVSNAFAEKKLDQVTTLGNEHKKGLNWTNLEAEERGYVNLSRQSLISEQTNTVFAKVTIQSDKKQVKKLYYGLSDRGVIYLNGEALAASYNSFRSQDYRHLGTIGFNDAVYLPLKKGENELWIAISEDFGGWGVMAAFIRPDGINLK